MFYKSHLNSSSFVYATICDLKKCLTENKIENWHLLDLWRIRAGFDGTSSSVNSKLANGKVSLFPLEWFDDTNDDFYAKWLDGKDKHGSSNCQAIALLPNAGSDLDTVYDWCELTIDGYDANLQLWNVTTWHKKRHRQTPGIFLMTLLDSVPVFVGRLSKVMRQRDRMEVSFKMAHLLDCLVLTGLPRPSNVLVDRVEKYLGRGLGSTQAKAAHLSEAWSMDYAMLGGMFEIQRFYRKKLLLDQYGFTVPAFLKATRIVAARIRCPAQTPSMVGTSRRHFAETRHALKQRTVYSHLGTVVAMQEVQLENEALQKLSIFVVSTSGRETLADFERTQTISINNAITYLKQSWALNWTRIVRRHLLDLGRGAFDISTDDWRLYERSKARLFLALIRCRMETSVRELVWRSIDAYCEHVCAPCEIFNGISADFQWGDNLLDSPFARLGPHSYHVFQITLEMDERGAFFVTDLDDFVATMIRLLDTGIQETHFIDLMDPMVMRNLTYPNGLHLSSVGVESDTVVHWRHEIRTRYAAAVIPLKAYAREYHRFVEAHALHVETFMINLDNAHKSTQELKAEILRCIEWRDRIQTTIPMAIVIGPFQVLIAGLKTRLLQKFELLLRQLQLYLASKLTNETQRIVDEYHALMDRLRRRPSSIDDLTETVAWMAQLPAFVANLEHLVKIKLFEFDILDGFGHALDDAEAMVKWTAVLFPYRIRMQIEPTEAMFEAATEQFAKQQTADLMAFEEQTEQLNQGVFHFCGLADTAKAREYAIDAVRLWNGISDADKQGGVLNRRQTLFGRTAMDLSGMRNLRETKYFRICQLSKRLAKIIPICFFVVVLAGQFVLADRADLFIVSTYH